MAARFEIYADASGEWRFRLKAANGEQVAQGHRVSVSVYVATLP